MPDDVRVSQFERRVASLRSGVVRGVIRHGPSVAGRAVRMVLWGAAHFLFVLVGQVAELASPLLLVLGAGWLLVPRALSLVETSDAQVRDVLSGVASRVPTELTVAGHTVTPTGLIVDGLLLMVVAAGLSTLTAVLANELYRDR